MCENVGNYETLFIDANSYKAYEAVSEGEENEAFDDKVEDGVLELLEDVNSVLNDYSDVNELIDLRVGGELQNPTVLVVFITFSPFWCYG